MPRWVERILPWVATSRDAHAALESANQVTVETAERKGRAEAVSRSIQQRVFAENHISQAVVDALRSRT